MTQADSNNDARKRSSKEALSDILHEQRELLHQVLAGVLEDSLKGKA